MQIYEYRCSDCDTKFEKLVSFSRANKQPACPNCCGEETHKLLSTFASVRGGADDGGASSVSSGGGCSGCGGGNCSSCH